MSGPTSAWRRPRRPLSRTLGLRGRGEARGRRGDEDGFTLVELLIVIVIVPVIIISIGAGLVAVFSIQGSVSHRLTDSSDAQVVSAHYVEDVQSSLQITTNSSASQCGPGKQLLGLGWNLNTSTNTYETIVSYSQVKSGTVYLLRRNYCTNGPSGTPNASETISFDIPKNQPPPVLSPSSQIVLAAAGPISSQGVTNVQFTITEPQSGYTYALSAVPASSSPPSTAGQPIVAASNTSCGFAATEGGTVFNGTYAQTLCFVDFSAYVPSEAAAPQCEEMVAAIPGGFTLSFCMSESGNQPMFAASLPTYPEAFLGNTLQNASGQTEPFYTGLGCPDSTAPQDGQGNPAASCIKPAMYQTDSGYGPTNTLTFTDISVTTATGAPATGWEFVSADAETTDSNETITWSSNKTLGLLPNSPCANGNPDPSTCPLNTYGNTCNNLPNWNGPQGNGTSQIVCEAGSQETSAIKTGTPMVEALTPTTMTVGMKGAGLEGIAVGLLLS